MQISCAQLFLQEIRISGLQAMRRADDNPLAFRKVPHNAFHGFKKHVDALPALEPADDANQRTERIKSQTQPHFPG